MENTSKKQKLLRSVVAMILAVSMCFGMVGCAKQTSEDPSDSVVSSETTEPTDETQKPDSEDKDFEPTENGDPTSAVAKANYSITTAVPNDDNMKLAVGTFDGGEISNSELNVYFWMEFYNFMNSEMGSYAQMLGLDASKPLNLQASMSPANENDENSAAMSWEQYFLQSALKNCAYYKGLELEANANNFVLPEAYQSDLDSLEENVAASAKENNYESVDAFVQTSFGTGTTFADYKAYMTTYITAYAYYETVLTPQCEPSDDEVEAYFDENAESYKENNHLEKSELPNINVRHILITPAEEYSIDTDEDGTNDAYSDEEWAAAEEKANDVYAEWQKNPTEDNFGALAKEYTADGNGEQGGLYEDVYPGQMVSEFNDWCFDADRKVGDSGVVKTPFGYHVMFFSGKTDTFHWFETAKQDLTYESLGELSQSIADKHKIEFNCLNIVLCDVITANTAEEASE